MLYSPKATIAHSLEFLGSDADAEGLARAQVANGSIGNAPAATAMFASLTGNAAATAYLAKCMDASGDGAVPVLYPCDTFESLWSAYQLRLAGAGARTVLGPRLRAQLRGMLANGGVSLAPSFPAADADETSVALLLMAEAGEHVDPTVLQQFATSEGHFVSFAYERHASLGVNVHVLHALDRFPDYPDRSNVVSRLLEYIESDQRLGAYWIDKWHISPHYASSHVACAVADLAPKLRTRLQPALGRLAEWLLHTQNADGSWGHYGVPTLEETAYAVTGLWALARMSGKPERETAAALAGAAYLDEALQDGDVLPDDLMPPLWIDKCLYTPRAIVRAAVAGAVAQSQRKLQELRGVA
jgi:halimadienyl-diphosphate synthase